VFTLFSTLVYYYFILVAIFLGAVNPSSHEMRYKPFLGSMSLKTQKMRKRRGRSLEISKYEWEWYDDPSRRPPSSNLFLEGDPLTRKPCQPPM
jgi:cell fate regulator YaaT (PSP1 superfamily)